MVASFQQSKDKLKYMKRILLNSLISSFVFLIKFPRLLFLFGVKHNVDQQKIQVEFCSQFSDIYYSKWKCQTNMNDSRSFSICLTISLWNCRVIKLIDTWIIYLEYTSQVEMSDSSNLYDMVFPDSEHLRWRRNVKYVT